MHCFVIELRRLIPVESMLDQIKENSHAQNVGPNINSLIVKHEKTFQKFPIAIKIYSKPSLDVNVVHHEGWCIQVVPYEIVIF